MATETEKQELIDTLKFTPRNYTIILSGYGGEIAVGTVDRKIYDYFQEHDIDLNEWNSDWDNEMEVPAEFQPFEPGAWYSCDDLAHETGVELSDSSWVTIQDENGDTAWEHALSLEGLDKQGVVLHDSMVCDVDEQPQGTVVVIGQSAEKGMFFEGEIHLTAPFDPTKLQFGYSNIEGWKIVDSVIYDGEYIDSDDYDTVGKSMEVMWLVVGEEDDE